MGGKYKNESMGEMEMLKLGEYTVANLCRNFQKLKYLEGFQQCQYVMIRSVFLKVLSFSSKDNRLKVFVIGNAVRHRIIITFI